ncbi:MAG TPA: hypothetical protein VMD74_00780, partial [Candidatus Methylomirabilis sp.]|nr:hypothetical protein [Candidatus Methylomirabilis sp.]
EDANPPVFSVRIGTNDNIHFSYLRFIVNQLREQFGFQGVPIKIFVKNNPHVHGQMGLPGGRKRAIPGRPAAVPRRFRAARRK